MAGLYTYHNVGGTSTNKNGISFSTSTIFYTLIPALTEVFALIKALALAEILAPA